MKNELELKLGKVKDELKKVKIEFEKAQIDKEKYVNASKAIDTLIKGQIQDKMKRGIGYNATPPPYNNNYIPPITNLLERHGDDELPIGASEVDPSDEVIVEDDEPEGYEIDLGNKKKQENISLENQIITLRMEQKRL